ncbi:putative dolichyl-phosphate-mannose--protein mannosyltransferase [Corynebacterium occultum]|uniref:Polyprenol-phosphate-mannose--protein mannosyltransferase n=1 Tax=Corynebacterium occultum TaxID=2675219 RepID=A0A6B8WK10_9CORY|nr:putative dolichyl-phosphate-mannose--protein mannosyltransferase [Corynebacterium occultum]
MSTSLASPIPAGRAAQVSPPNPRTHQWSRADTISTALIGLLAVITRFFWLGRAESGGTPVFDEKHYVPQAWDMVESWVNPLIGGIESNPGYGLVVHPPLAKQLIALGEMIFGYSPWGWRLMTALFGVATVLMIMALTRRLSNSWQVASIAGLLAVFDGVLLITSRFGMLDIFQVFFIVAAAWALIRDHQQVRQRFHDAWLQGMMGESRYGPRLGFRWWRFTTGIFLGLALGVKWSGLYYIAFFGLLSVFTDLALRRRYGVPHPVLGALFRDTIPALGSLVLLPALLYLWSWRAWFASETSVYRHAKTDGTIPEDSWLQALPEAAAGWLHYHLSVLEFHGSLTTSGGHSHPWDSKPWSWLVAGRPILYSSDTDMECAAGTCREMIFLFGTPAIWWLTIPALLWGLWSLVIRRQRAFLLPLVAFAAGFLPWLAGYDRQMYFFYAAALVPFTIVLIALACGQLWGEGKKLKSQQLAHMTWGSVAVCAYLALVVAMFFYWLPIFYGIQISDAHYFDIMWLPSWI